MGVFLVAAFTATLGGGLYAVLVSGLSPTDFAPMLSLSLLVYTVVGGSQSLVGPVMAGLAFGLLPQITQSSSSGSASAVPDVIAGATVILVLVFRPEGLASLVPRFRLGASAGTSAVPEAVTSGDRVRHRLAGVRPPTAEVVRNAIRCSSSTTTYHHGGTHDRGTSRTPVA